MMHTHQWNYKADPAGIECLETLRADDCQSLHLTSCNQIILIDSAGRLLRRYSASQRAEALKQWSKYR